MGTDAPEQEPRISLNWKVSLGGTFMVGAIFWAGSCYNRLSSMESSLQDIRTQLPALGKVSVLEVQQSDMQRQISMLQDQLNHVKRIVE